ncbi:hypothetical protein ACLKMH_08770 [Psychromonas sp. KJ10-10]|uniref:hypothetical protein n=1 Tax=Psychromonas sp. KJ10-10 TaxID=3391823 RepID=UPI0039B612F7
MLAILGIDKSQMEACLSIGMTRLQAMKRIILPQSRSCRNTFFNELFYRYD